VVNCVTDGLDLQLQHCARSGATEGEAQEDQPRDEEDVASAVYVAQAGEEDGKPYDPLGQASSRLSGGRRVFLLTHVCEDVCEHNPRHIDKLVKVVGDCHHGGRDDGCV
jgi:hypothetical protein